MPPLPTCHRNTATLIPIRIFVSSAPEPSIPKRFAPWTTLAVPVGTPACSAHLIPTGVKTMQSGHSPRPQWAQETPVSRFGWR